MNMKSNKLMGVNLSPIGGRRNINYFFFMLLIYRINLTKKGWNCEYFVISSSMFLKIWKDNLKHLEILKLEVLKAVNLRTKKKRCGGTFSLLISLLIWGGKWKWSQNNLKFILCGNNYWAFWHLFTAYNVL